MNNSKHPNDTNENNDASLSLANTPATATATDEKIQECINNIMRDIDINQLKKEEVKVSTGKLLKSIHGKEWKQAVRHFLRLYNDLLSENKTVMYHVCRVFYHMSKVNLQFPLGKEDNFEDSFDLLIDIDGDDENDGNDNENTNRREAKEILLLLIVTQQTFQDSTGRHGIDVAVKEGLKWDDGLKLIVEQFSNQQGQTIMNAASYYGLGWNGGMEIAVEANKEQIGIVDHVTSLYPFMLAAVDDTAISYDLNTVYNLIKRRPDVVKLYTTYSRPIQIRREKRKVEEIDTMM